MASDPVVETFDVVEDGRPGSLPANKAMPVEKRSSHFKLATKLSEMALSRADPTLPIEGTILASSSLLPNASEVYWADSIGRSNTPDPGGV
jgi:hypothetical protein